MSNFREYLNEKTKMDRALDQHIKDLEKISKDPEKYNCYWRKMDSGSKPDLYVTR